MDQSRRAVESYWRSRMIDAATSDEDKVTPVYKLEEICELLRSSHVSIVKEVSDFVLKRLQHKSPIVKQKALRVIKYAVGKSGAEFRREMQRNSVAVRQLIHYKGHPDPLKGDSLNKDVRETAQEALSALFGTEDSKPSAAENLGSRIQGFGNTNFDMALDDKKSSFLSEVVNIGSITIKQGLSCLTQSPSLKKNEAGTYRGPNLRRSLTTESDFTDQYEEVSSSYRDTQSGSRFSKNVLANWGASLPNATDGDSNSSYGERTREEKLVETIVTPGGVRLQPTRDALQIFLQEASKLDTLLISHALGSKLKSPLWQVRMKAVCVLEALLRKKDDEQFSVVALYFSENNDLIIKCSESPQASLREKALKALSLLDGEQTGGVGQQEQKLKAEAVSVELPDLIDTGDSNDLFGTDERPGTVDNLTTIDPSVAPSPLINDFFGEGLSAGLNASALPNDDPFADVSFHSDSKAEHEADMFSGMKLDKPGALGPQVGGSNAGPELFDIFGSSSELSSGQNTHKTGLNDIMAGLSINENGSSAKQKAASAKAHSGSSLSGPFVDPVHQNPMGVLNSELASQVSGRNTNLEVPLASMPYNYQPGYIFNPSLVPQPMNYNAMTSLFAQQQLLATMANFQHLGNLQPNSASFYSAGSKGEYSSPLPDIFNPSMPNQTPTSVMSGSKKEETKAFDFISDHLAAGRDPKRVN